MGGLGLVGCGFGIEQAEAEGGWNKHVNPVRLLSPPLGLPSEGHGAECGSQSGKMHHAITRPKRLTA